MITKLKFKKIKNSGNVYLFTQRLYKYLKGKDILCNQVTNKNTLKIILNYKDFYIHPFDIEDKTIIRKIKQDIKKIYKKTVNLKLSLANILLPNTKYLLINQKIQKLDLNKYKTLLLEDKKNRKAIESMVFILISNNSNDLNYYKLIYTKGTWEIKMS